MFIYMHLFAYVICFYLVWFGAGRVVTAVTRLSQSWGLPTFTVSFFLLGIMTSLPELAIGTSALIAGTPRIFAGNLLGAMMVMFLAIIPLLSILNNGLKIPVKQINQSEMLLILATVVTPGLLVADGNIHMWEGWVMIAMYGLLAISLTFQHTLTEKIRNKVRGAQKVTLSILGSAGLGVLLLLLASRQIVTSTLFFAEVFSISPFLVSLLVVAVGTNIPEISIIFRALLAGKSEIALADYLGSASANTLLFGVFTVLHGRSFTLPGNLSVSLVFLLCSLVLFFVFSRSRNTLSRREGVALLLMYAVFVFWEIWQTAGA